MYYPQTRYPFILTRSNQSSGMVESETTFEGFVQHFEDGDTMESSWEVEAYVTGFTQYKNGKVVSSVSGIKTDKWEVSNLKDFEADCVEAACDQFKLKAA